MNLRVHSSFPGTRIAGALTGIGFIAIGLFAVFGAGADVDAYARDRAFWFGVTASIGGILAIGLSLFVERLDNIWCAPPRPGPYTLQPPPTPQQGRDAT